MSTLRKLVSDVRSMHKILSTDSLITDRAIASEVRNNSILLIKRETNLRKLWATSTLFTTIPCLEMIEVPISECCDYQDPCNVARTRYKIPRISEGNYQYLIQGVYSINAMGGTGTKLKEITINRYTNLIKLPIIKKEEYYWILNDYLYVNNPLLQAIRLAACFEQEVPNELMYPETGCGGCGPTDEDWCMNPLDKPFSLPGYLEKQVLELTSQKLLSTYFQLKTDITSDNLDGQAPNVPPTR
jgi:Uri superfamily endonuclease